MDIGSLFNRGVSVDGAPLPADTATIYGTAVADSADGTVLVEMDGDAVTQPAQEETTTTLAADQFQGGTATLPSEPFPGSVVVYAESEGDDNVLPEDAYQVNGDRLTIEALAGGEPVGIEWETHVQQAATNADFVGGAVQLVGEPDGLTVLEDVGGEGVADWQPVAYALDGTTLTVEGMEPNDGRVVATYVRTVSLVTDAGEQVLPDMPAAEDVTVTGRSTTAEGDPVDATVTGWNLAGDLITIPEGYDTYTVTYTMDETEEWNLTDQTDDEPLPDYDPDWDGDAQASEELEPEAVTVGHELTFEPDAGTLAVTVDGTAATFTLDVRTVTVDATPQATRHLIIEYDAAQAMELTAAEFANGPVELPTVPNDGTVSVEVGGAALDPAEYSVTDLAVSIPALVASVSQYVVTYAEQVPVAAVELPTFPAVAEGDTVQITVVGGVPTVTAVQGAGDSMQAGINDATTLAVDASTAADAAQTAAEAAQEIAEATGQHVWEDTNGEHVTLLEREQFEVTPAEANILMNAYGILLRNGLINYTQMSQSGFAIYDGQGNAAANIVGLFTDSGLVLGRSTESHMEVDYHSLQLIDKEGSTYFYVSDLRDSTGVATITENSYVRVRQNYYEAMLYVADVTSVTMNDRPLTVTSVLGRRIYFDEYLQVGSTVVATYTTTDANAKAYTFGIDRQGNIGPLSVAEGIHTAAVGAGAHAEGSGANALGAYSHAEGLTSYAEGWASHAEGHHGAALGEVSHAEGDNTFSNGFASHAEGANAEANGDCSHAEGNGAVASGHCSHAQNLSTIANGTDQTALGRYNVSDTTSAVIIGNGTASARSNALTVDWSGNVTASGNVSAATFATANATVTSSGLDLTGSIRKTFDNIDSTTLPNPRVATHGWNAYDSNGILVNQIRTEQETDGRIGMALVARQGTTDSGGIHQNIIRAFVSPTGDCTYSISDPAAFRAALNMSATETNITPSNATATVLCVRMAQPVCTLFVQALKLTSTLANGSSVAIGTIPSGYRPAHAINVPIMGNTDAGGKGVYIYITTAGAMTVYNRSGATIPTSVNLYGCATWVL